jgi:raffinose/stachyose/melibiose transport system permease protein
MKTISVDRITPSSGQSNGPDARVGARGRSSAGARFRRQLGRTPIWAAVVVLLIIEIYPLVWILLSSFKTTVEFDTEPMWALPKGLDWQNYIDAFTVAHIGVYFVNSLLVVFPSLALILILSAAAGFGLEVMRWRGRNTLLLVFLAGIMIPAQMLLLPLFTVYFQTQLIDTRWSLIITYTSFGLPLSIFLMAGFFKAVSHEVVDAAMIDGANIFQIFFRVALPMVANGLITVALVQFFFLWNDLLFSLTFISSDDLRTIQTGLLSFTGQYGQTDWGPTLAATSLAVFPTLIIYLLLNQRVIQGLTAGSVKG